MGVMNLDPGLVKNVVTSWGQYSELLNQDSGKKPSSGELAASVGSLCQQGLGPLVTAYYVDHLEVRGNPSRLRIPNFIALETGAWQKLKCLCC
jgi:hypothetical protein